MIEIREGNIFTIKCQTIVNTINCVGVMEAGIAFEFRLRSKRMHKKYKELCKERLIDIGKLWIYQMQKEDIGNFEKVLNFPTKKHWKNPSEKEYIELGLDKFISSYKQRGIESIAFSLLGADKGGLDSNWVIETMQKYLVALDINIEIWKFNPRAKDDLFDEFRGMITNIPEKDFKEISKKWVIKLVML